MPVTRQQSNAAAVARVSSTAELTGGHKETTEVVGATSSTAGGSDQPGHDSDENCSICLGPFNNKSFTNSCAHSFCFACLRQWSKVKAECPLCKQPFASILYNIRSNNKYDVYKLPPTNSPSSFDYSYLYDYVGRSLDSLVPPPRHYYSLGQASLDADLTLDNFSRYQFRNRRSNRHYNHQHPVHGEHQYSTLSFSPASHISAAAWTRGMEHFRLQVYKRHMGPPAVIVGYENFRYCLTPAMVAASAHRLHRIMPWLTRELRVLLRSHQNVRQAINVIQPLLTQVTIDSEDFRQSISPLLGQRSRQFIQEFTAFANSALSMEAYDRKAMYRYTGTRTIYEDSENDDNDDEVIDLTNTTSMETMTAPLSSLNTRSENRTGLSSPAPGTSRENTGAPSVNLWVEDETVSVSSESDDPVFRPDVAVESDSDVSLTRSDIVFLKYDKPWGERSPVELSSDSDENEERGRKKKPHLKASLKLRGERSFIQLSSESDEDDDRERKKVKQKQLFTRNSRMSSWSSRTDRGSKSSLVQSLDKVKSKPRIISRGRNHHKHSKSFYEKTTSLLSYNHGKKIKTRLCNKSSSSLGEDAEVTAQTQNTNLYSTSESVGKSCPGRNREDHKRSCEFHDQELLHRGKKRKLSGESARKSERKLSGDSGRKLETKLSGDSSRKSELQSYKKHPSGHKNTKKPGAKSQESERRHKRKNTFVGEKSDRTVSSDGEAQVSVEQGQVGSSIQASYLAPPDIVQHIPLNLWVSTWPLLHVSRTFPPSSSSSSSPTFPPSAEPHSAVSPSLNTQNNSCSESNSQTISSDSSIDSDSDDSSNGMPSHKTSRNKRHKAYRNRWTKPVPKICQQSASSSTATCSSRNWRMADLPSTNFQPDNVTDVMSIDTSCQSDILHADNVVPIDTSSKPHGLHSDNVVPIDASSKSHGLRSDNVVPIDTSSKPHCLHSDSVAEVMSIDTSCQPDELHSDSVAEVLSIDSDDDEEYIITCSSSEESDSDDVEVIDSSDDEENDAVEEVIASCVGSFTEENGSQVCADAEKFDPTNLSFLKQDSHTQSQPLITYGHISPYCSRDNQNIDIRQNPSSHVYRCEPNIEIRPGLSLDVCDVGPGENNELSTEIRQSLSSVKDNVGPGEEPSIEIRQSPSLVKLKVDPLEDDAEIRQSLSLLNQNDVDPDKDNLDPNKDNLDPNKDNLDPNKHNVDPYKQNVFVDLIESCNPNSEINKCSHNEDPCSLQKVDNSETKTSTKFQVLEQL